MIARDTARSLPCLRPPDTPLRNHCQRPHLHAALVEGVAEELLDCKMPDMESEGSEALLALADHFALARLQECL